MEVNCKAVPEKGRELFLGVGIDVPMGSVSLAEGIAFETEFDPTIAISIPGNYVVIVSLVLLRVEALLANVGIAPCRAIFADIKLGGFVATIDFSVLLEFEQIWPEVGCQSMGALCSH